MLNQESLKNVIKLVNSGKSYPALQLVKSSPETAALISKLVKPVERGDFDLKDKKSHYNLNHSQLKDISESIKSRIKDNENIALLFPDIELAIQILVSSILSPKDMVKTDIIYRTREPILPSEITMKLIDIVTNHIEGYYGLKDDLAEILRDALFTTGSYIKTIIPESAVDEIINSNQEISTESISELFVSGNKTTNLGILGNPGTANKRPALERFIHSDRTLNYDPIVKMTDETPKGKTEVSLEHLEVTDNYKLLKLPKVIEAANKNKIKKIIKSKNIGLESNKLNNVQLGNIVYKSPKQGTDTFVVIPRKANVKRKSVGRPLTLRLPSEAVIPVYIPGDESKHIGYFVLVDEDGNPLTMDANSEYVDGLSSMTNLQGHAQNQSLSSMLIQKAKRNLVSMNDQPTLDHVTKVYANIVETDLIERLNNGIYGKNVAISDNEEIYRIMLARSLATKFTRLIYVPAELTTYFAFKYFSNGVGKSMLDDLKFLTSLRAIMLLSKVMAMTKSAINNTHVNITLDEDDPDPQKTIETAQHEIAKIRQQYFPLGINTPVDLVDWIQRAGIDFSFEGHPGIPAVKIDYETRQIQPNMPDSELDELLRKQTFMAMGLSPETVDNGFNSEFATTVVSNNVLLAKRVSQLQNKFSKDLSDFIRKLVINDSVILEELKAALLESKGSVENHLTDEEKEIFSNNENVFLDDLLERFMDSLVAEFPKPDTTTIETQSEAYNAYEEALDKALTAWVGSELVTSDTSGQIADNIDTIKSILKSYFLRRWMADNGYMVELNDIITTDDDGKPNLDIYDISKSHLEGLILSATKFINNMQGVKTATDKDLNNMNVEEGSSMSSTDTSSDTSDEVGSDDTGADDGFDLGI